MLIVDVEIPAGESKLSEISMRNLGKLVVLAGKNGSGKSRIMSAVAKYARAKLTAAEIAGQHRLISERRQNINSWSVPLAAALEKEEGDDRIEQWRNSISSAEGEIERAEQTLRDHERLTLSPVGAKPIVIEYSISKMDFRDPQDSTKSAIRGAEAQLSSVLNLGLMYENGLLAIEDLFGRQALANSSSVNTSESERDSLNARVVRLNELMQSMLGTSMSYSADEGVMIFDLPIAKAKLSQGQSILLQIAISVYFQDGSPEELVIFFDEPETHLHPDAAIRLLETVVAKCPSAQVWIATHSVTLLAHVDPGAIWFVKDGVIEHGGTKSEEVLDSLLGGDKGAHELSAFVSLPAQHAAIRFASESLLPPSVASTPPGDPQTVQIREILSRLRESRTPLSLLDYGMGSGRLLSELAEMVVKGSSLGQLFDYFGMDEKAPEKSAKRCREMIAESMGDDRKRYFTSSAEGEYALKGSIDVIVICNVLHEMLPRDWLRAFGPAGFLTKMLSADGFVLVVEDQLLRFGERAHQFGCFVLDQPQLKLLFRESSNPGVNECVLTSAHESPRYRDRLKAHLIPAKLVALVDDDSVTQAVASLEAVALDQVKGLYQLPNDYRVGRLYAFWTQQLVNSILFRDSLALNQSNQDAMELP